MDIEKYRPVIDDVIRKLKVKRDQQEDLRQECYLQILTEQQKIEEQALDPESYIARLCRNHILDLWRHEKVNVIGDDSLDDPRISRKVGRIPVVASRPASDVFDEAMGLLNENEKEALTRLYVDGEHRVDIAADLGVLPRTVNNRARSGANKIKKHFGA